MQLHELAIGTVIKLNEQLVEVIAPEGLEITSTILDEFTSFLLEHTQLPVAVLVNKKNPYTYTYEVQAKIGEFDFISGIAVLIYSRITEIATQSMLGTIAQPSYRTKFFWERESAINWLEQTLINEQLKVAR